LEKFKAEHPNLPKWPPNGYMRFRRQAMNQRSENIFPMMELPDGIMGQIVTILHEPREILNLALTCQRLRNICEGVARAFIDGATDKERSNLPQVKLPTTHDMRSPGRSSSFGNWGLISKYCTNRYSITGKA